MKQANQSGFTAIHMLLILVLVGLVGFTGWKVYDAGQTTKPAEDNTVTSATKKVDVKTTDNFLQFQNQDLGFKFSHPNAWGAANYKKGSFNGPGRGVYYQVTFADRPEFTINLVVAGFSSPLDGCGYEGDPIAGEEFALTALQDSLIGWDNDNIITVHGAGQGNPDGPDKTSSTSITPSGTSPGFQKLTVDKKVLVFKDMPGEAHKPKSGTDAYCGEVSQSAADRANAYRKFVRYAVNFSTSNIKGVNAQYDARKNFDQKLNDQIIETLNSITKL